MGSYFSTNSSFETKQFKNKVCTYNDGVLHSFNDNPSVVYNSGLKQWHDNGKLEKEQDNKGCMVEYIYGFNDYPLGYTLT